MRPTRALIHLDHLRHNLSQIRALSPRTRICLAVKADAYGHGAVPIARAAVAWGVEALGVATVEEGLALRSAGIKSTIILYGIASWEELPQAIGQDIELFCTDAEQLDAIARAAREAGLTARIHLKVDTGMGRIGCAPEALLGLAKAATAWSESRKGAPACFAEGTPVQLAGVCTHFPRAEDPDPAYTRGQLERFLSLVDQLRAAGIDPGLVHAANSGGLSLFAESRLDMVRPGIMAYGYAPADQGFERLDLKPVMELRTALSFLKQVPADTPISYGHRHRTKAACWVGTVPLGYADGLPRACSGKLHFLSLQSDGKTVRTPTLPQVGTICMDQCMVELGEGSAGQPPLPRWTELVVFGPQAGAETAASLARAAGTIPYEISCGISPRVPRVYLG